MDIPVFVANGISETETAITENPEVLGVVVAAEFLGTNAAKAFEGMRSIDPDLPIVIMASDTNIDFEKTVRQMGIFYYLLPPYDREEFLKIVCALHSDSTKRKNARRPRRSKR